MGALLGACDYLQQTDEPQPPPPFAHVIAANVGVDTPMPADGIIQLTFDRFLNPATINRQGITLRDLFGNPPGNPLFDYDPITRVVTISNANPGMPFLTEGQSYELAFPISTGEAGAFGLLTIDGVTIDPATPKIAFPVGPATGNPPTYPTIDFCTDVMPIFRVPILSTGAEGACGTATCHGLSQPPNTLQTAQGLVLDTEQGILSTAINVPAEGAATGGTSTVLSPQYTFPVGMPIIAPGYPGNSYLLYKLLVEDDTGPDASGPALSYTACNPVTPAFAYGPSAGLATADEATRLGGFIPGRRMPWGKTPLTLDQMERIRMWILQGAPVPDCSTCYASAP